MAYPQRSLYTPNRSLASGSFRGATPAPIPQGGTIASMNGGLTGMPVDEGAPHQPLAPAGTLPGAQPPRVPGVSPAAAGYTGAPLQVGQQSVGFNPQSFVGSDAYQFLADQGRNQIERSAAAKGTLLTGGTLKDLTRWGQGNASTFWGQQLDHDYRMSALNAGISGGNADRALSGMSSLVNAGSNAANGMGNAYVGAGNAAAGGTIGAQNQVNTGVSNVANTIGEILARRRAQPNGGIPNGGIPGATTPPFVPSRTSGGWGSN